MARYLNQRFGDYQLIRLLGEGGFAEVYEARQVHLGTSAAIKILKDAFTPAQIEALRQEALIVSQLDHPHIVRLLNFSIERGIPYLVMSYAPGGSLDKQAPRGTTLALPTIITYVRQIAAGLQCAHDQRIIHRDLKPANFLLTQDGRVQVADFGIALMAQNSTSYTKQEVAGTWIYMAPEQFQAKAVVASDQYSLGIVVYQWLCGKPPFTGQGDMYALPLQHINTPPPSLCERIPTLSSAIEQVIMKALAKRPEERFASIQEFATALADAGDPPMQPAPGQIWGDYRLVRLLGSGGFADVYEAEHRHLGTQAAIKILKGTPSPEQIETLRQEARLVMELDHPHIVRVLTFSVERARPYLVLSYAAGGTLDTRHPAGIPLPIETVLTYTHQLAAALQYAHDQHIVHCDIKPENVLLAKDGRLLLADFGIAVMASTTHRQQAQQIIGTWHYMAPEQFVDKAIPASDQYALAILIYRWLCGELPFAGLGSMHALVYAHMNTPPPSLREKVPTLSPAVEQVVMKALAKKPEERFVSVQAFADALEQASKKPAIGTTLLRWTGSAIVIDPGATLWHATAGQREAMGSRIIRFALTEDLTPSFSYNPLNEIRRHTPEELADYTEMTKLLTNDPSEKGEAAALLLLAVFARYMEDTTEPSLRGVAQFVEKPSFWSGAQLISYLGNVNDPTRAGHLFASKLADEFMQLDDEEFVEEMWMRIRSALSPFTTQPLDDHTKGHDLPLAALVGFSEPTTLYVTFPKHDVERLRPFLRLLRAQFARGLRDAATRHPTLITFADDLYPHLFWA